MCVYISWQLCLGFIQWLPLLVSTYIFHNFSIYSVYHLKRTIITYYGTKLKSEAGQSPSNRLSQPFPWHSNQGQSWLLGRCSCLCAKAVQVRTWRINQQNVCSFWSITSHRNNLLLFRVVFWVILPCKMIVDRYFRGAYCLHHQGRNDNDNLLLFVRNLAMPMSTGEYWIRQQYTD
jgi:hypothetical protein